MNNIQSRFVQYFIVFLLVLIPAISHSATVTVTNTNIDGPGSLIDAINRAEDGDTIKFDIPLPNTIFGFGYPISKNLTIIGPGSDKLTIGTFIGINPVFEIGRFHPDPLKVNISGLTISFGIWGISNFESLTINDVVLSNNDVGIIHWGNGRLEINNSVIRDNLFDGIHNINVGDIDNIQKRALIIQDSIITENGNPYNGFGLVNAGGLSNDFPAGAYMEIYNSEVSFNTDAGIFNLAGDDIGNRTEGAKALISGSTISSNGTEIDNGGQMTVIDTEISDGFWGIFNMNTGVLSLSGSTLYSNFGGIKNEGSADILNSTFSDNNVGIAASVIQIRLNTDFITVTDNEVGLYTEAEERRTLSMKNSIIGNNELYDCEQGTPESRIKAFGNNLDTDRTCVDAARGSNVTQVTSSQLNLGPLQDNGGPTQTHALNFGSVAINSIKLNDCNTVLGERLSSDQRGFRRPALGKCDIGAYEFNAIQP